MAWIHLKEVFDQQNNTSIGKSIIWNNEKVKNSGNTLFYKNWYEKGIKTFEHIFDYRNNSFYDFERIEYLYNIRQTDVLKYHTLIKSIPIEIKERLIREGITYTENISLKSKILESNQTNQYIYRMLINNTVTPSSQLKWREIFPNDFHKLEWKKIYSNIYKTSIDSILRSFNYKFLMRIIPTNKLLLKYKLVESSLCSFCNTDIESIEHLYWECFETQKLWRELNVLIASKSLNIIISKQEALLGITKQSKFSNISNYLILIMKFYIHSTKYNNRKLSFDAFMFYLKLRINIEEQIALKNDKYDKHVEKWSILDLT